MFLGFPETGPSPASLTSHLGLCLGWRLSKDMSWRYPRLYGCSQQSAGSSQHSPGVQEGWENVCRGETAFGKLRTTNCMTPWLETAERGDWHKWEYSLPTPNSGGPCIPGMWIQTQLKVSEIILNWPRLRFCHLLEMKLNKSIILSIAL